VRRRFRGLQSLVLKNLGRVMRLTAKIEGFHPGLRLPLGGCK